VILGLIIILAALLFFGLSFYKVAEYAKMPLHARMDLYPVPQEKGRHQYGGSYMEEVEWWHKPRQISKASELIDMMKEMLFIKKLFDNQRSFWWISYAFHLGIYFLIAWTVLLVVGALTEFAGLSVSMHAMWWTALLYYLTVFTGVVGLFMTAAGNALLLIRRIFDPILSQYTTPQEYFNLVLLLATLVSGIIVWSPDLTFTAARQVTMQALTLSIVPTTTLTIHLLLLAVTFIYIPLSKMGHYVGKYFTYHKILWENEPNVAGSEMEKKVKNAIGNPARTKWAAAHMQSSSTPKNEA
jgi:nitrate reductase gamma subunit